MFVPVGIFNDDLNFRVYCLCRADNQRSGCFGEQVHPELCPALLSLCGNTLFTLAACIEKIIQDQFIKMPCSHFNYLFQFFTVLGICIAVGLEVVRFTYGYSYPACRPDSPVLEKFNYGIERFFIYHGHIAMGFEVNLIYFEMLIHLFKCCFQPEGVLHLQHLKDPCIN